METKLRESVSVKDFGAVGDGVTDDSAKIQAAIDYADSLGGCVVYLPTGNYLVSTTITIPSEVLVCGAGADATKLTVNTDTHAVEIGDGITPHNRGGIEDLAIYGYWAQVTAERTNSHGIVCSLSNRSRIHNIRIYGCYYGVSIIRASDVDLYNVHVAGGGTDRSYIGFYLPEQDVSTIRNAVQFTNCMAVRCLKYGFRIISGSGSKILNCESIGISSNDETGIGFYIGDPVGGTPSPVQFIHIANCLSDQNAVGAWKFAQGTSTALKDITVSSIWAGGTDPTGGGGEYGILVDGGTSLAFSNLMVSDNNGYGIHIKNSTKCSFTGGVIKDHNKSDPASSAWSGIFIQNTNYTTINGFTIQTDNVTASDVYSIEEAGSSNDNVITGNACPQGGLILGSGSIWSENKGVKTKNYGLATITNPAKSVTVAHGLDFTPTFGEIQVTPRDNPEYSWSVGVIDATNITVSMATTPTSVCRFSWRAERTL